MPLLESYSSFIKVNEVRLSTNSDGDDENDFSADLLKIEELKRKFGSQYKFLG